MRYAATAAPRVGITALQACHTLSVERMDSNKQEQFLVPLNALGRLAKCLWVDALLLQFAEHVSDALGEAARFDDTFELA